MCCVSVTLGVVIPEGVSVESELSKIACNLVWKDHDGGGGSTGGVGATGHGANTVWPIGWTLGGAEAQLQTIILSIKSESVLKILFTLQLQDSLQFITLTLQTDDIALLLLH